MKTIQLEDDVARAIFDALAAQFEQNDEARSVVKVPGQGEWTERELRQLKVEIEPYTGALAMLNLTAGRPDEEVRYFEVCEAAEGRTERQVRSDLAAMTRLTKELFGRGKWPVRAWQQASDGIMTYVMPKGIAEWWVAH